jgi:hypothetical protein
MTKFPKSLYGTNHYYGLIRPYPVVLILSALPIQAYSILSLHQQVGSPVPLMSRDIVPVVFTPDTGTVNKLVFSVLIPMYRATIGSQYQQGWLRRLIERFTFVQLLYPFLTDISARWRTFCLLTLSVQYQPLERVAPQGGLETLPVKRIRETNHNVKLTILLVRETSEFTSFVWDSARFIDEQLLTICLSSHHKL